eukprot:COSAG01_NODE_15138_length_1370_cov_0.946499_3_plen_52_part_00
MLSPGSTLGQISCGGCPASTGWAGLPPVIAASEEPAASSPAEPQLPAANVS